jgi:hypothetical protein
MAGFDRGMEFHNLQLKQEALEETRRANKFEEDIKTAEERRKVREADLALVNRLGKNLELGMLDANRIGDPTFFNDPNLAKTRENALTMEFIAQNGGEKLNDYQKSLIKTMANLNVRQAKFLTTTLRRATGLKGQSLVDAIKMSRTNPEMFNAQFGDAIANATDALAIKSVLGGAASDSQTPPGAGDDAARASAQREGGPAAEQLGGAEAAPVQPGTSHPNDARIDQLKKAVQTFINQGKPPESFKAVTESLERLTKQRDEDLSRRQTGVGNTIKRLEHERKVRKDEWDRTGKATRLTDEAAAILGIPEDQRTDPQIKKLAAIDRQIQNLGQPTPRRFQSATEAKVGEEFGGFLADIEAAGLNSFNTIELTNLLESALDAGSFEPGSLAPVRLVFSKFLELTGMTPKQIEGLPFFGKNKAATGEVILTASARLVTRLMGTFGKGNLNKQEVKLFTDSANGLSMTREGQEVLIEFTRNVSSLDSRRADFVADKRIELAARGKDINNTSVQAQLGKDIRQWNRDNPALSNDLRNRIIEIGNKDPFAIPPNLPEGSEFIGIKQKDDGFFLLDGTEPGIGSRLFQEPSGKVHEFGSLL